MTNKPIRKAVFPVAGLGTRILPATKAMPKEMLTIVDRPLIQYAMDEAREAGIEHFIFVTGRGKSALEDHFDHAFELEATLAARGKSDAPLASTRYEPGSISYVRQQRPLGLGHAIWCARELIGDEPFAVLLPDDLMRGSTGCLSQMMTAYDSLGGNIICVQDVAPDETHKYGIIDPAGRNDRVTQIRGLVEKPAPQDAPSNLAIVGRYIVQPEVLDILAVQAAGAGGEIQLTDAMAAMIREGNFHGLTFDGVRYDCGDKLGFVRANIGVAMEDETMRQGIADLLAMAEQPKLRALPDAPAAPMESAPRRRMISTKSSLAMKM